MVNADDIWTKFSAVMKDIYGKPAVIRAGVFIDLFGLETYIPQRELN